MATSLVAPSPQFFCSERTCESIFSDDLAHLVCSTIIIIIIGVNAKQTVIYSEEYGL